MARRRLTSAAALAVLACVAWAGPASALRALHVDALGMRADRTRVHVGEVFHLAIHAHVRENVAALDELVVPDVGAMQLEGDERSVTSSPAGADVVETLTLEPTRPGTYTFAGAYLDAVDARTGKPSRFSANPVRVVVEGRTEAQGPLVVPHVDTLWRVLVGALAFTVLVPAAAILATVLIVRSRRRRPPMPSPAGAPAAPAAPPSTRDVVRAALRAYRVSPPGPAVMELRGALFAAAGASAGATLRDALAGTSDSALRTALTAAERAAFGPVLQRDAASSALIGATEEWLR